MQVSWVWRAEEGLRRLLRQHDDTSHVCTWTLFSPAVGMGFRY